MDRLLTAKPRWSPAPAVQSPWPSCDRCATQAYIGLIAAIGLVSAAIPHGFVHGWGARLGRQRLTLLARAGGAGSRSASWSASGAGWATAGSATTA